MFKNAVVFNNDNDITLAVKICVGDLAKRFSTVSLLKDYVKQLVDFNSRLV